MTIQSIKKQLIYQDRHILAKQLGYQSVKRFEKTLDKFLTFTTIETWLENGNYDLVNSAEEFFIKLANYIGIGNSLIQTVMNNTQRIKQEKLRFKDSYIFVNTNFKRKNEPIHVLALCEQYRRLPIFLEEDFLFKSAYEILNLLSIRLQKHYKENQKGLIVWGKIISYQVHLFNKLYIFNTDGTIAINQAYVNENKASLKINKKDLD